MAEPQRYIIRSKDRLQKRREKAKTRMPLSSDKDNSLNLLTGKILRSKKSQDRLLSHTKSLGGIDAAVSAWNNPEKLVYVRQSPLGETKDLNNPKDAKNVAKKAKRGVVRYNIYELKHGGKLWELGLEQHKAGFEQFYYIKKK